jgi:hypothetical protein
LKTIAGAPFQKCNSSTRPRALRDSEPTPPAAAISPIPPFPPNTASHCFWRIVSLKSQLCLATKCCVLSREKLFYTILCNFFFTLFILAIIKIGISFMPICPYMHAIVETFRAIFLYNSFMEFKEE